MQEWNQIKQVVQKFAMNSTKVELQSSTSEILFFLSYLHKSW